MSAVARVLRAGFILGTIAVWAQLLVYGLPYYRLGLADRIHSPLHADLRPNGRLGLLYAYIGTACLLLLLLYLVRKRAGWLRQAGPLRVWLGAHIALGILGPAMITLHSSFKLGGAIAIGYWAMIGVMASGFAGYYLLRQVRGAMAETEHGVTRWESTLEALDRELAGRYGLTPDQIERLRVEAGVQRAGRAGVLGSLVFLVREDVRDLADRIGIGAREIPGARLRGTERRRYRKLVRDRRSLERRHAFLRQAEELFHYWHVIHRPFTFV
ncbi:MAG TPA: hypothetical protein VFP58_13960, partial [Candidatus Eisenbacteria bacterium]|nr:hypothetical protein [Candidatus Eisenbacteria bacterium]